MSRIYLDYNASAPLRPEVILALRSCIERPLGNPSSVHFAGAEARSCIRAARGQLASALGCAPDQVIFTSGATEANASAIAQVASWKSSARDTVLTCTTEHTSVLSACTRLRESGLRIVQLPVESDGLLDPDRFEAALGEHVLMASVMWVNNETGVIQPLQALGERARAAGVAFHTDAVQALGRVPLALDRMPIDFASFSAHKLGGPQGVGALYVAPGQHVRPLIEGGGQERGRRAGTENVLGIVGFGAACAELDRQLGANGLLERQRDWLYAEIEKRIPNVHRNGSTRHVAPHVLNVSFPGAPGDALVEALDLEGIAVSAGSACHAGSTEPSHVLLAMGLPSARSASALRISLGWNTRAHEIDTLIERLPRLVARVREAQA